MPMKGVDMVGDVSVSRYCDFSVCFGLENHTKAEVTVASWS